MVPKGLITQIALIGLSVGIFFTYLQPNFSTVRESQDKLALYKSEREKVQGVNAKLNSLVSDAASISTRDRALLDRYLPPTVDDVAVQRDLLAILDTMGVVPTTLAASGEAAARTGTEATEVGVGINQSAIVTSHQLNVGAELRYEEILELLRLLEINAYPLDVISLGIGAAAETAAEGGREGLGVPGALSLDMEIATYALTRETVSTE